MTSRMQYCRRRQRNAEARFAILRVAIRGAAGYHNGHSRRSATCRASVWKSCSPSDTQHHDGRRHEQREQLKAATRRKERRNLLYIHCQVWHGVYGSARHDQGKETEGMVSDDPAVTHDISKIARRKRTWGQGYRWVCFFHSGAAERLTHGARHRVVFMGCSILFLCLFDIMSSHEAMCSQQRIQGFR